MVTRYFPWALRVLGFIIIGGSVLSATLLNMAPPPHGLKVLDPDILKTTAVVLLAVLGGFAPALTLFTKAVKYPLAKAAVFAAAAFTNAMTLGPQVAVAVQDVSSTAAEIASLVLTLGSLLVYMDRVQSKLASKRAGSTNSTT
ncbi:hypothetical protein ACIPY2_08860 [Paenarthrobacter sp. NPDC089675]|uniref:hypothetical protein n=1 Tax=Paenarthrobacter sp. NPDC089675 TaxID=3364376 RepID=UPI0037F85708